MNNNITARPRAKDKKAENEKKASEAHSKLCSKIDRKHLLKRGRVR